jgi:hypothetical protein
MAVALRSTPTTVVGTGLSHVCSPPAGIVDNDILLLDVCANNGSQVITPPAGFTLDVGYANGNFGGGTACSATFRRYWKRAASESGNYTVGVSISDRTRVIISAWSGGILTGNPIDASSGRGCGSAIAGGPSAAGIITTVADVMLVYGVMADNAGARTYTPPTGMAEALDTGGDNAGEIAYVIQAVAGATGDKQSAISSASQAGTFLSAIKPEPAGVVALSGIARTETRVLGAALEQAQPLAGRSQDVSRVVGASLIQSLALGSTSRSSARVLGASLSQILPLTSKARSSERVLGAVLTIGQGFNGVVRAGAVVRGAALTQALDLGGGKIRVWVRGYGLITLPVYLPPSTNADVCISLIDPSTYPVNGEDRLDWDMDDWDKTKWDKSANREACVKLDFTGSTSVEED